MGTNALIKNWLVFVIVFLFAVPSQALRSEKISLKDTVRDSLNNLLETTTGLHEAFFEQDELRIGTNTQKVISVILLARETVKEEKFTGIHLGRVLDSAINHFVHLSKASGEERKKSLKMAFEQIVQIATTYKLNSYRVFYCHANEAVWIQKSWKAQNPFSPQTLASCGIAVR